MKQEAKESKKCR